MREAALEFVRDAVEIVREQLEHEVPRRFLGRPWAVVLLVGAEQDALTFLTGVDLAGEVDHVRQFATVLLVVLDHLVHRLGHQVVVFHSEHWKFESAHAANFTRPQATGIHHMFGVDDMVLVGDHIPRAVLALGKSGDPRVGVHLGATILGANGIGVCDAVGVYRALVFVEQGSDEVLLFEQWIEFLCFLHRDDFHVHPEVTTSSLGHPQPVESLWCVGQLQTTWQVDAAVLTRFLFDLFVQIHRVLLQARHVRVTIQGVHATSGVPSGTRGELLALHEHHIRPAFLGEVVEDRCTDDTATDDDDLRG